MAKVVVTGASGFVGAWLVRALLHEEHEVHVLARPGSDLSELEGLNYKLFAGDVCAKEPLRQSLRSLHTTGQPIDAIFHLAGLIAYRKAQRAAMQKVNVQGTANVVEACLELQIPRLVYMSSVVAVGIGMNAKQIMNEDSPYNAGPLDLGYFETKHAAELLVLQAVQEKGLNAVILNPSTIYGAGDARKNTRKTQLQVAQGKFPFYTSGGVNVVGVESVIEGLLAAWKKGESGQRYILSSENLTIQQLFQRIAFFAGVPAPKVHLPDFLLHALGTVGDAMDSMGWKGPISKENAWTSTLYHWFDSSKAQRQLGFKPTSADFALENSVRWMRDHGLLQK